jgi:hypothetical protein
MTLYRKSGLIWNGFSRKYGPMLSVKNVTCVIKIVVSLVFVAARRVDTCLAQAGLAADASNEKGSSPNGA